MRNAFGLPVILVALLLAPAVVAAQDFLPPLGPGNALDAALRAAREYLAQHGGVGRNGEPYPLLLVRPLVPLLPQLPLQVLHLLVVPCLPS